MHLCVQCVCTDIQTQTETEKLERQHCGNIFKDANKTQRQSEKMTIIEREGGQEEVSPYVTSEIMEHILMIVLPLGQCYGSLVCHSDGSDTTE